MKRSKTPAQVTNNPRIARTLYGIMVSEAIGVSRIKVSRIFAGLTCVAVLLSLCLSPGIMVGDHARAQSLGQPAKVSSDLSAKAHSLTNSDKVKVIVQLRAPMSSSLNSFLNSNGVHVRKTFQNLSAHAVEMPASLVDSVAALAKSLTFRWTGRLNPQVIFRPRRELMQYGRPPASM